MKCFEDGETAERAAFGQPEFVAINVDKVPLPAGRSRLDSARISERVLAREPGVAGESPQRF